MEVIETSPIEIMITMTIAIIMYSLFFHVIFMVITLPDYMTVIHMPRTLVT